MTGVRECEMRVAGKKCRRAPSGDITACPDGPGQDGWLASCGHRQVTTDMEAITTVT
jgi:hypothetical protein